MTRVACLLLVLATYPSSFTDDEDDAHFKLLSGTCCGRLKQLVPYFLSLRQSKEAAYTALMKMEHGCVLTTAHQQVLVSPKKSRVCTLLMQNFNWHLLQLFPCLLTLPSEAGRCSI